MCRPNYQNKVMKSSMPSDILTVKKSAESEITNYKIQSDIRKFKSVSDNCEVLNTPDEEWDILISRFLITIKSNQGKDYEPSSLKGSQSSIQR